MQRPPDPLDFGLVENPDPRYDFASTSSRGKSEGRRHHGSHTEKQAALALEKGEPREEAGIRLTETGDPLRGKTLAFSGFVNYIDAVNPT
jgi:hypothetical protein